MDPTSPDNIKLSTGVLAFVFVLKQANRPTSEILIRNQRSDIVHRFSGLISHGVGRNTERH